MTESPHVSAVDVVQNSLKSAERSNALEARRTVGALPTWAASALDGEPPQLRPHDVERIEWQAFETYPQHISAQIVAGLLENEGVPAIITASTAFPGLAPATLWVPQHLMHRARWIVSLAPPGDAELSFLATGELHSEPQED